MKESHQKEQEIPKQTEKEVNNKPPGMVEQEPPVRPLPLEPSQEELLQCQFSSWFPTFRHVPAELHQHRSNVTIKSEIISPLPEKFVDFLHSDGIRLPEGATKLSSCAPNEAPRTDDDDDENGNWGDKNDVSAVQFSFPQLNQDITNAIRELGGSVIPKLNWSAPKDATWVNEGTLKCKTPGDVYLLLKSSDFCMHDLQQYTALLKQQQSHDENRPINKPPQLELVLRKWCNLYPSMEFRCFVRNHTLSKFPCCIIKCPKKRGTKKENVLTIAWFLEFLVAISQRNHTQHYPHLLRDRFMIRSFLLEFFDDVILHRFAQGQLKNYVFDVYLDKSERAWLLDFNVWSIQTDALLYTWDELVNMELPVDTELPELRIVETALEVRQDPLASYRAPMDTVELASAANNPQMDTTSFEAFMAMCKKPSERDSGDDDESCD
jgi:hypothetical protein